MWYCHHSCCVIAFYLVDVNPREVPALLSGIYPWFDLFLHVVTFLPLTPLLTGTLTWQSSCEPSLFFLFFLFFLFCFFDRALAFFFASCCAAFSFFCISFCCCMASRCAAFSFFCFSFYCCMASRCAAFDSLSAAAIARFSSTSFALDSADLTSPSNFPFRNRSNSSA